MQDVSIRLQSIVNDRKDRWIVRNEPSVFAIVDDRLKSNGEILRRYDLAVHTHVGVDSVQENVDQNSGSSSDSIGDGVEDGVLA